MGSEWMLTDKAMNGYFKLIIKEYPNVHAFDTFFYERYSKSHYQGVQKWTKKVDIFSKRKVFFPINIVKGKFSHWVLVVADMVNQELVYYDSLKEYYNKESHMAIMEYLGFEHEQKLGKSFPLDDWKFLKGSNPVQNNGVDCGVFVCIFAEYLSRDVAFNFTQKHILEFRKLIAYEISTKQIFKIDVNSNSIEEEINRIIYVHLTYKIA